MRVEARNFGAFRSNHLKSSNSLPQDRFTDLDRMELVNRLERLADVRRSVVARGKALVANPNYPDKRIIKQVSHLLAGKLSQ
jgi:hypothetical protein